MTTLNKFIGIVFFMSICLFVISNAQFPNNANIANNADSCILHSVNSSPIYGPQINPPPGSMSLFPTVHCTPSPFGYSILCFECQSTCSPKPQSPIQ
ncbi:11891_t:CDS:2 [Ambispora leptoticha]|uniref:11891_t:CDS:1 n=1 Tax=Ambispora leptoticha TaxID=144679 RepID=A0A9N9G415_9GLOM|nr:11891_t:CDS:2 [Ambispora leptoticha]